MLAAPASIQPHPASITAQYGFEGVRLGGSAADLRKAFPNAACRASANAVLECVVADQPIGGGFYARSLTYRLVGDRLTGIQFHTSIDGFAFAVAKLKHDFGPPADIRRDSVKLYGKAFDHVAFTWRNGRSTIALSDPVEPDKLSVRMNLNDVPDRPRASSARSAHSDCGSVTASGKVRSCT